MLASCLADLDIRGHALWEPLAASAAQKLNAATARAKAAAAAGEGKAAAGALTPEQEADAEDQRYWNSMLGLGLGGISGSGGGSGTSRAGARDGSSGGRGEEMLQTSSSAMPGDVLGYLAHGVARSGTSVPAFWEELAAHLAVVSEAGELSRWQPDDLARVSWALATGQGLPGHGQVQPEVQELLAATGQAIKGRLHMLTSRQLAEVALAFPSTAHSMPDIYSGEGGSCCVHNLLCLCGAGHTVTPAAAAAVQHLRPYDL
jgi:hypothetical protein